MSVREDGRFPISNLISKITCTRVDVSYLIINIATVSRMTGCLAPRAGPTASARLDDLRLRIRLKDQGRGTVLSDLVSNGEVSI